MCGDCIDVVMKIGWCYVCIVVEMVYLIVGCFD